MSLFLGISPKQVMYNLIFIAQQLPLILLDDCAINFNSEITTSHYPHDLIMYLEINKITATRLYIEKSIHLPSLHFTKPLVFTTHLLTHTHHFSYALSSFPVLSSPGKNSLCILSFYSFFYSSSLVLFLLFFNRKEKYCFQKEGPRGLCFFHLLF